MSGDDSLAAPRPEQVETAQEFSPEVQLLVDSLWPVRERLISGECEIHEQIFRSYDAPPVPESESMISFNTATASFRMDYSSFDDPDLSFKYVENDEEMAKYYDEVKNMQIRRPEEITRKRRPLKLIDPRNLGVSSWNELDRRLLGENRDAFTGYTSRANKVDAEIIDGDPEIRVLTIIGKKGSALRKLFLDPSKEFAAVRLEIWYPRKTGEGFEETPHEVDEVTWSRVANYWVPTKAVFTKKEDRSVKRELDIVWKNVNGEIPQENFASKSLLLPPEATVFDNRADPDRPVLIRGGPERPLVPEINPRSWHARTLIIINVIVLFTIGVIIFFRRGR